MPRYYAPLLDSDARQNSSGVTWAFGPGPDHRSADAGLVGTEREAGNSWTILTFQK